jgi:hypothetical protein
VEATRRTRRALLLVAPVLLVAVVAAVVAVSSRGDAAFVYDQQHRSSVSPQELELLVQKAHQPTPTGPGRVADTVRCTPGGATGARNPWTCDASYPSGRTIRYGVNVKPDGSYVGADRTRQFFVRGCCVAGASGASG